MSILTRWLFGSIIRSVSFVTVAFLALFFFFDMVDELARIGRGGYTLQQAFMVSCLGIPSRIYDLMPVTVLIGAIATLSNMAKHSEFTVLRTAGLSPWHALKLLTLLGAVFATFTFVVGDYLTPHSNQWAQNIVSASRGGSFRDTVSTSGAWLRQKQPSPTASLSDAYVHVKTLNPDGELRDIQIFEFNSKRQLLRRIQAQSATVNESGLWTLHQAHEQRWPDSPEQSGQTQNWAQLPWNSTLNASVVAAAMLPLSSMTTLELWRFSRHLGQQQQSDQQHRVAFWKKAIYPLACFVMLGLALPFAYLHARAGSGSWKIFSGIMMGISFAVFNNLSGHLGTLQGWIPWLAAAAPSLIYMALSLAAFAWLVRYR
jgi:lipopolysaccharide export system permease protein